MQVILKKSLFPGILTLIFLISVVACHNSGQKSRLLIITGGHDFDTSSFYSLFENLGGYQFDTISQPYANQFIAEGKAFVYDVLVFYDSWQTITEAQKTAYITLTKQGKGFLFLHHSLASYQHWDEFFKLRGGGYYRSNPPDSLKDMRYKHDLDLLVEIVDPKNPVTRGMKNFKIRDEGYNNIIVNLDVIPLLKTMNPDCAETIGWTLSYNQSKIIYLMGGHDKVAFDNAGFRELVKHSLDYLAK